MGFMRIIAELLLRYKYIFLVIIFSLIASFSLLHSGLPPTHDGEYHVVRFWQFDKVLRDGDFYPRWAPDLNSGLGIPLFSYIYPFPNYIASFLHIFGVSFIDAFKLNLFLAIIMAGIFFYLWTRHFFANLGAMVGAIFYLFSPYLFVDVYIRGSVGEVWALSFFPGFLWAITELLLNEKRVFLPISIIFLGLIIFSHNILAFLFFPFAISYSFILILISISWLLVILPEIIYVKDIYIPSYHRANTVFKLTYQSFVMFSILIGYILIRLKLSLPKSPKKSFLYFIFYILYFSLMLYPFYSIPGYYGNLEKKDYKGLYGLNFIQKLYPDDYRAILWLNKNVSGQPVVLEAVGDSYTDYERISMATGLPTIEGWLVHEWLWRGSYDEPGKRAGEVQQIYEEKDALTAKILLAKYSVRFIVVGKMEKDKYPNLEENKFSQIGKIVFQEGTTKIYQIL